MNNYSWIQKKLHQFALSSQFMRESSFDFESSFLSINPKKDNHVFIAGLARSGSTILLNAIYQSKLFASLTYCDMPFVLAPNLFSKILFSQKKFVLKERMHDDGIKYSLESPEALEEVFWKTFPHDNKESIGKFIIYLGMIMRKYNKNRYLSKNNQNIKKIEIISKNFKRSQILIPFRDPLQQGYSLLSQHKKFIDKSKIDKFISYYLKWIGHTEFGPNYIPINNANLKFINTMDINHWLEQWYLSYSYLFYSFKKHQNINFICYEKLCSDQKYWFTIIDLLKIDKKYQFEFKESKKNFSKNIDSKLLLNVKSLYAQLICLDIK